MAETTKSNLHRVKGMLTEEVNDWKLEGPGTEAALGGLEDYCAEKKRAKMPLEPYSISHMKFSYAKSRTIPMYLY